MTFQKTRIDLGLQKAHTDLFSPYYGGARPDVKKLAFILTDGKQNPKGDVSLKDAASKLINDGIKTISVGIGSEVGGFTLTWNEIWPTIQWNFTDRTNLML